MYKELPFASWWHISSCHVPQTFDYRLERTRDTISTCQKTQQNINTMEPPWETTRSRRSHSKHTYFQWKVKWWLEHLGALGTMGETAPLSDHLIKILTGSSIKFNTIATTSPKPDIKGDRLWEVPLYSCKQILGRWELKHNCVKKL